MNDLISRSELIKHFEAIQQQENVVGLEFIAMIDEIKEQPTAYDIDKVIEDLKKITGLACEGRSCSKCKYKSICREGEQSKKVAIDEAIEIVKQGGDADYVCKWRIVDRPHNLPIYNTSCGKIRMQYTTGVDIYCNGCGKKIKVVE